MSGSVVITLVIGEDEAGEQITRKLSCDYYADGPDPSVGYGGQFCVEDVEWDDDPNAEVSEDIWPGREEEIERLAEEAAGDDDSFCEPDEPDIDEARCWGGMDGYRDSRY